MRIPPALHTRKVGSRLLTRSMNLRTLHRYGPGKADYESTNNTTLDLGRRLPNRKIRCAINPYFRIPITTNIQLDTNRISYFSRIDSF